MKIAFRVDASHRMGIGHVRRMKSLAQAALQKGHECLFLCRDLGVDYDVILGDAEFDVRILPVSEQNNFVINTQPPHSEWAKVPWHIDAQETSIYLADECPDWLVIDHYSFDARWHRQVREKTSAAICAVDDTADRSLDCAVLIDHNYSADHRAKYGKNINADTLILGGPSYALLAREYADAKRYQFHKDVRSIGIFLSGTDTDDMTSVVLDAVALARFGGAVEVVLTSTSPHLPRLKARVKETARLKVSVDLPNLAKFFARHDLQIGGGGGATWERCCVGAPTLGIIIAENQRSALEPLKEMNVLETIDCGNDSEQLSSIIKKIINDPDKRRTLAHAASQVVDGKGAMRAIKMLEQVERSTKISPR